MAAIALEDGIDTVIATPHCHNGVYINSRNSIISACERLNHSLSENDIALKVLPGAEVHMNLELLGELEKGRIMTINDTGRYFSLELPDQFIPASVIGFINRLKYIGITPVITHPERNTSIQDNLDIFKDFLSAGALSQVTAGSLTGYFGRRAGKCSMKMVNENMVHMVASDAHSTRSRPPILSKAYKKVTSLAGRDMAREIFLRIPGIIINGKDIN
jgi:protein-tyrosine phosphatase